MWLNCQCSVAQNHCSYRRHQNRKSWDTQFLSTRYLLHKHQANFLLNMLADYFFLFEVKAYCHGNTRKHWHWKHQKIFEYDSGTHAIKKFDWQHVCMCGSKHQCGNGTFLLKREWRQHSFVVLLCGWSKKWPSQGFEFHRVNESKVV